MKVKRESEVAQSCPTLCDPMDCSLPGSSIHGICQARVLEWGAIAFSVLISKLEIKSLLLPESCGKDKMIICKGLERCLAHSHCEKYLLKHLKILGTSLVVQ